MRIYHRVLSVVLAIALLLSVCPLALVSAATVVPRNVRLQWTDEWKTVYYGTTYRGSLYDTGCGIFSTVNAVGYLTGNEMSVTEVADWAYEVKALNYYAGGVDRTIMYPKLEAKFGKDYGFTVGEALWAKATTPSLLTHLQNGGAAIAHVSGHFIAIVGYDASTGYFHVYDSAPSTARGTGNGDAWVSTSWITTSTYFTVDWFCPLTRTGTVINRDYGQTASSGTTADKLGTYKITTQQLNVRSGASTDYDVVTTVSQGDLVNVTSLASNGWGKFVAPDGKEGWGNVTTYGQYIGIDALAYETGANTNGITASFDGQGRLTLTNASSETGQYDLFLPHKIGNLTTPYMSIQIAPIWGDGYYFGLTQKGSGYFMMRDSSSADELVEAYSAPYMTSVETLEIDISKWWAPSQGYQIDHVRLYVAPNSGIRVNYCYFTASSKAVTDASYNMKAQPTNINLMHADSLDIVDRSKSGGYTYENGVLTVNSDDENGYSVVFEPGQSFSVYSFMYWLLSFEATTPFNISMLLTHAGGESWATLATDYFDQFGETYPADGFLPARSGSAALGLYGFYSYNNIIPSDGMSTVKQVEISLKSKGKVVLDAIQLSENQQLIVFSDQIQKSDSTKAPSVVFATDVYDVSDSYLHKIASGTTVAMLLSNIQSGYSLRVLENGTEVNGTAITKTGQQISVYSGSSVIATYIVVVTGDTNGDGNTTTVDARCIVKSLVDDAKLSGAQAMAADVNGDQSITSVDVRELIKSVVS